MDGLLVYDCDEQTKQDDGAADGVKSKHVASDDRPIDNYKRSSSK